VQVSVIKIRKTQRIIYYFASHFLNSLFAENKKRRVRHRQMAGSCEVPTALVKRQKVVIFKKCSIDFLFLPGGQQAHHSPPQATGST